MGTVSYTHLNDLLAENEQLEARAKASEKGKMKDTMERAKLKSELDKMCIRDRSGADSGPAGHRQ